MLIRKKYYCLAILVLCSSLASAQSPFIIGDIYITGNRHTKNYIIERELPFKSGDSIYLPDLIKQFGISRQQLINTKLFNEATVSLKSFRGLTVDILIDVKERWYIFPLPYLKPVDRNLAEWARQGYGTDRLNYGFKFTHYNFSGRNDKLRLWLVSGYTKQIQFQYEQPYADKQLKSGFKIGFSYSSNKEINYATINNQQQFADTFSGIQRWNANIEYDFRPGLRTFHAFRAGFTRLDVDKNILALNPKYYDAGINRINIPEVSYTISHFDADYIPYPLKGWSGEATVLKRGIHSYSNMWQFGAKYSLAVPLGNKTYFNLQQQGLIRFPFDQPFYNTQLFGYGDLYLRGLDKYVIDGVGAILTRQTFKKELVTFNLPTYLKSRSYDVVPFHIYAKIFADAGYAINKRFPENSLTNRMLYTTGFGLDVVTFYDFVFRFDYSFNQLGQNGLFLHFKSEF